MRKEIFDMTAKAAVARTAMSIRGVDVVCRATVAVFSAVLLVFGSAFGQGLGAGLAGGGRGGSSGGSSITMTSTNDMSFLRDERSDPIVVSNLFVDENTYFLGSGDVLQAVVWGARESVLDISITNDETSIIPTVGAVDISGLTFGEAREKILAAVKQKYRAARVDVFLSRIKDLTVQVSGEVNRPGTHTVAGNLTLSSIIETIGGVGGNANVREIQIIHPRHPVRVVDLMRAQRIPDSPSITLRNGDRIFVPRRDLRISVNGDVPHAGVYDFVAGEKLSDIIALSGGLLSSADSSAITITRFVGVRDSIEKIIVSAQNAENFALERDDMITVNRRAQYRPLRQVRIWGEVMLPGTFAIQENQTSLSDLITLAGGLTEHAFWGSSRIVRRNLSNATDTEARKLSAAQSGINITPSESNFLRFKHINETALSIDFSDISAAGGGDAFRNLILREGDEIYIGRNERTVNVMGAVVRPGLVNYSPGQDAKYYIEQAGGFMGEAQRRRVKVIKAGTQNRLSVADAQKIESGDAIWVPQRDFVSRQERQQDVNIRSGVWSIVGGIATTLTAAITVITFVQQQ